MDDDDMDPADVYALLDAFQALTDQICQATAETAAETAQIKAENECRQLEYWWSSC